MKNIIVIVAILFLTGCTTIHFDDGANATGSYKTEQWHHNWALALYEGSDPVNLEQECGEKDWKSVQTELTFINWLASLPVNFIGPIWYPKTVEVTCG